MGIKGSSEGGGGGDGNVKDAGKKSYPHYVIFKIGPKLQLLTYSFPDNIGHL